MKSIYAGSSMPLSNFNPQPVSTLVYAACIDVVFESCHALHPLACIMNHVNICLEMNQIFVNLSGNIYES